MRLHRWLSVFAVVVFAVPASAGGLELKPGLWEVKNKMQSAGGQMDAAQAEMEQQLAAMPPEQRKMMEDMMAKRGVKLGGGGLLETSGRICMTKEMIEKHELPVQQGKCKTTVKSRVGNTMKMTFACTDPVASGEGAYTIESPGAYSTKMAVRMSLKGKPETMNMDTAGKWLGADCGAVKPKTWSPSPN